MGNSGKLSDEKESLKRKLMAMVLLEVSKPYSEIDSSLVDECIDFLMELEGKERLSEAEVKRRVNEIPFEGRAASAVSDAKTKVRAKRLALAAAVIAFILVLFSIFTLASDSTFGDLLSEMGHSLMDILDNDSVEHNGVTMYNYDETRKYQTVEELISAEKLDILYPTWLPENVKVSQVTYISEGKEAEYNILCENPIHAVLIYPNQTINKEVKQDCLLKEINGYEVYYFTEKDFVQGDFIYKETLYAVTTDTEENLFRIIENLKELD